MKFVQTILDKLAHSPVGSWFKAAVSILIAYGLKTGFSDGLASWRAALTVVAASLGPVIINYLNPADERYGVGN